jgi:CheY-like chemotaxis protein
MPSLSFEVTDSSPPSAGPTGAQRTILALAADLLFASRIRAVGAASGARIILARSADDLVRLARESPPDLVLFDFETRGADPGAVVAALKADQATAAVPVVAFGRHDNLAAIEAARSAGADRVMARSSFVRILPDLLAGPDGA